MKSPNVIRLTPISRPALAVLLSRWPKKSSSFDRCPFCRLPLLWSSSICIDPAAVLPSPSAYPCCRRNGSMVPSQYYCPCPSGSASESSSPPLHSTGRSFPANAPCDGHSSSTLPPRSAGYSASLQQEHSPLLKNGRIARGWPCWTRRPTSCSHFPPLDCWPAEPTRCTTIGVIAESRASFLRYAELRWQVCGSQVWEASD